jgi:hypothetical protein
VTTIAVPPRTRLLPTDPFASLTGVAGTRAREAPYRLTLAAATSADTVTRALQWRRRGDAMHGDGVATGGGEARRVHVEVDLRGLDALLPRGALLVLLDVAVVMLLWGRARRRRLGRWLRPARAPVAFVSRVAERRAAGGVHCTGGAVRAWSWYRLQDDDRAARELLVREARTAASDVERRDLAAASTSRRAHLPVPGRASSPRAIRCCTRSHRSAACCPCHSTTATSATTTSSPRAGSRWVVSSHSSASGACRPSPMTWSWSHRREATNSHSMRDARISACCCCSRWRSGRSWRSVQRHRRAVAARPVGALSGLGHAAAAMRAPGRAGVGFAPVPGLQRHGDDLSTSRAALEAAQRRTAAVLQHVASGCRAS